ncbi:MAG: electron transfer flavoprotein subunit alpha/FixB family protein [candidate division WOR-3 bacterium]|uniref:Electron transfer flavoprotein subunit alpha/FixB family protein n=1 Tax=Caldiarchaeum subterraneum TaxID=311458 RepID=A0A7C5Q484_CALS0
MGEIWTFVEIGPEGVEDVSLEIMGRAAALAAESGRKTAAVVTGWKVDEIVQETAKYPVDKVFHVDHSTLVTYDPSKHAKALHQLVEKEKPEMIFFGATYTGADIASRLAVRTGAGLIAHVTYLGIDPVDGRLVGHVPGFGGSIVAVCKCRPNTLQIATVRPGVFEKPKTTNKTAEVVKFTPSLDPAEPGWIILDRKVAKTVDVTRAEKVVVAGMGTGGDLTLVKKLADRLGAQLAVTRPLADIGVAPRDVQVGSTGISLRSKAALVLGVSGASHFVSGIQDVKTVISVNTDRNAPIFQFSDYCVQADLFKIVPKLIEHAEKGGG